MKNTDILMAANKAPMVERGVRTRLAAYAVIAVATALILLSTAVLVFATDERSIPPATAAGALGALVAFLGVRLLRHADERARPRD